LSAYREPPFRPREPAPRRSWWERIVARHDHLRRRFRLWGARRTGELEIRRTIRKENRALAHLWRHVRDDAREFGVPIEAVLEALRENPPRRIPEPGPGKSKAR